MDALVVFESMFGNTEAVARAIGDGIASSMAVEIVEVGEAPRFVDSHVGLLVVGSPTHAFGLSRPATRADAAGRADGLIVSSGPGVREWLESLIGGPTRLPVACFDTRLRRPPLPGSAARATARRLRQFGFTQVARPTSFYVTGVQGPLVEGELERARRWGRQLALVDEARRLPHTR